MSFEIVYTSVRRGLRTGSKGFCTVAATEGIPRALHEKMESLSGYSHHESASGSGIPVNHSHLIVRIQRKVYHILSRVGDAGKDYSGRTNKIAHHLALTSAEVERFQHGPVSLFADDGFWYESWDDEPEEFAPNRLPASHSTDGADFDTWDSVFGDAGWAGVLGQSVASGMKPVSVIVPDGQYTMELLSEAMQLVPPAQRWKLCFSTYFARQAPGTQCHWKFVIDKTQEARRLRARSVGGLLDFANHKDSPPEDNPFVEAARDGTPQSVHQLAAGPQRRRATLPPAGESGSRGSRRPARRRRREPPPPPRPRASARSPFDVEEQEDSEPEIDTVRTRRSFKLPKQVGLWIVMSLAVAIVVILVFLIIQQL